MTPNALARSLSRKILGLALLNLLLVVAVVVAFAQWQFGLNLESLVIGPAGDRIVAIANAFGRDLDGTPASSISQLLATYSERYGADFNLVNPLGESLSDKPVAVPEALLQRLRRGPPRQRELPPGDRPEPGRGFGPPPGAGTGPPAFLSIARNPLSYWVGVRIPIDGPNGERGLPAVLLLHANSIFNSKLFFDWRLLLWLGAALASVAFLCWWPFVKGLTSSIRQMDRATEAIAEGRFDVQVTHQRRDELGHLGQQINRLANRLEGFVKHQKRFLGDIAHELCAPLARIQFALGILEQRSEDAQQTHVAVLREEIQEMSELVNELLTFSKAGMRPAETPLKSVDLTTVVQRALGHQVPGAASFQVAIPAGVAVRAHEPYLLRAVSNLLRNALRYAGEDGPISISARREASHVLLTVADCGPGLPEQSLEEVFAPFYRPEASRSRDTGGTGLGLAIVKSCVEACQGTVKCCNRSPSGLEVIISLRVGHDD